MQHAKLRYPPHTVNRLVRQTRTLVFLLFMAGVALASSATAQVPVLLVPGWLDDESSLEALHTELLNSGWPSDRVAALSFLDPVGSNRDHATEMGIAAQELLERTGAEKFDVVAHSMGGLATRWFILTQPGHSIRRAVFLGSPHRGTLTAYLAFGESRAEMMPGSAFLDSLNVHQPAPLGVEPMTIRTLIDTHILPGRSATLPAVQDHRLCCPTHAGLLNDEAAFSLILSFLQPT